MYHSHPEDRIQITEPISRVSGSVGLGWGLRICISDMFLGNADAAYLKAALGHSKFSDIHGKPYLLMPQVDSSHRHSIRSPSGFRVPQVDLPHLCPRHPLRCWPGTWTPFVCAELNNPCWNGSSHPAQLLPAIGCMSVCVHCVILYTHLTKKLFLTNKWRGNRAP